MEQIMEFLTQYFTFATFTLAIWQWILVGVVLLAAIIILIVACCVSGKRRRQKRLEEIQRQAEEDARNRTSGLAINEVSAIPHSFATSSEEPEVFKQVQQKDETDSEADKATATEVDEVADDDHSVADAETAAETTEAAEDKVDMINATPEMVEAAAVAAVKAQNSKDAKKQQKAQSAKDQKKAKATSNNKQNSVSESKQQQSSNGKKAQAVESKKAQTANAKQSQSTKNKQTSTVKIKQDNKQPQKADSQEVRVEEVVDTALARNDEVDESLDKKTENRPKNYHISLREDGKWQVKLRKGEKALKLFNTQAEAIAFAKEKAKNQEGHITIHKVDGKIRKQKY